ncbi:unnamed protein product [Boreogadus saida]
MDRRSKAAASDENTALLAGEPVTASLVNNSRLFLAVFSVVLGNFSFGYSLVYASPVQTALQGSEDPRLQMDSTQYAWFGSIYSLGAAAGGLGAMMLNDMIGRKMSIMTSALPSAVGYMLMGGASDRWMLLLGRFLTGVAGGMTSASIPVYISEISHPAIRGAMGSCPQITAVCGALVLYALGTRLPWRWLAVAGGVPAVALVVLVALVPSSPRRLLSLGREEEAEEALRWLRGGDYHVQTELRAVQNSIRSQGGVTLKELATPTYYRPLLISVGMRFLQQLSGITPTLVYMQYILSTSRVALDPGIATVIVGVVRLFSVAIAASLMDRAGRKALLYTSSMLMILSSLSLTMYSHANGCSPPPPSPPNVTHLPPQPGFDPLGAAPAGLSLVPLFLVIVFIFGYAMGWGPITWLLMAEVLPLAARGVASGLCVAVGWLTAFAATHLFLYLADGYGLYAPYLGFTAVCVFGLLFTAVRVPETRGRTLEEIENFFRTGRTFTIGGG